MLSPDFKNAVAAGELAHVKDEIKTLTADGIETQDGKTLPCDLLVCATGFAKSYDYLDATTLADLGVESDGLYLYRHMLPLNVPNLAFCGSEIATISNVTTHGIQADWICRAISGAMELPSKEVMAEEVEKVKVSETYCSGEA